MDPAQLYHLLNDPFFCEPPMKAKLHLHASREANFEVGKSLGLTGNALQLFSFACVEVGVEVEVDESGAATIVAVDGMRTPQPQFALVSTVDTLGDFDSHCVMLFDTREAAVLHACKLIVDNCSEADHEFDSDGDTWWLDDEGYGCPNEFLEAYQRHLSPTEYFHIKPVKPV